MVKYLLIDESYAIDIHNYLFNNSPIEELKFTMKTFSNIIDKAWDSVVHYRRWLHENPELSGQEKNTASFIADCLRKIGLNPKENVGGYGVTALIEGKCPGKCLGIRADFDALSICEETGLPFASKNHGVFHACGHDMHAAMLLGVAQVLNEVRDQFSGSVKLIFQPSEENASDSGAKKMISDGVLSDPPVDAILAQHVSPHYPTGTIALRTGAMTSSSDRFYIRINGKSSHGSEPDGGIDAVVIGGHVITALQAIVSRTVSPQDSVVLSIGKVTGGSTYNIIADSFLMEGTCRTLSPAVQDALPGRMESIIKGVTEGLGGTYSFSYVKGFSPTINDPQQFLLVRNNAQQVLGSDHVIIQEKASMVGEDFSFYGQKVPACFYWLGCRKPDAPFYPLHNSHFSPDEAAMRFGIEIMLSATLSYLG